MKNKLNLGILYRKYAKKIFLIMKISFLLLFMTVLNVYSTSIFSQNAKISINMQNATVREVVNEIERQGGINFLFNDNLAGLSQRVSVSFNDQPIKDVLESALIQADMTYEEIKDDFVVLLSKPGDLKQQQITITGRITDAETGEGLPGVSIVVQGTTIGTTTNMDGNYAINVPDKDAVLQFSFVGYQSELIGVGEQTVINVNLLPDPTALDEVVVVGFGTQRRVNLTGAVSQVVGDDLAKRPVGQTSIALQGIASGVTVTQRSGQPGGDAGTIRIRGIGTLNNSNPLILVDGTEMNINNIDPNLIESISVLKDAASASIYGSRAANGVILITTKRGKVDEISVTYNHYSGLQTPTNLPSYVSGLDHMLLLNEATINSGRSPTFSEGYLNEYIEKGPTDRDNYPDTDWQKLLYKDYAYQQNHFVTLRGGTENVRFLSGIGYFDQKGLIPNTDYNRLTARLNTDIQFSERLSAKVDMNVQYGNQHEPGRGVSDVIYWVSRSPAIYPAILSDGRYGVGWDGDNVYAFANDGGYRKIIRPGLSMNMGFNYKFSDYLSGNITYSPSYTSTLSTIYNQSVLTYYPDGELAYTRPGRSTLNEYRQWGLSNDFKALMNYNRLLDDKHNLGFLGGFQWESGTTDYLNAYRDTFTFPQYSKLNAGGTDNQRNNGSGSEWSIASLFSRVNYDYMGKYLFEANIRYDGSSRFAEGHKWGVFPSISAGWRISEEDFWSPLSNVLTNSKIRVSWGKLGNQNIGNYAFASVVNYGSYVIGNEPVTSGFIHEMANTAISWEETEMFNIGLDLNVFHKLNLIFDYYEKLTQGILWRLNVPHIIGMRPTYENAAEVSNKGWDLELTWNDRVNDFNYGVAFMLSDVKNEILDLRGVSMTGLTVNREGYPINSIYGLEAIGYITPDDYDADGNYKHATQFSGFDVGDIKYKDQNGDGVINADDEAIIGSTVPRFNLGLGLNADWKGIDFSMFWQGVGKVDGLLYRQATMPFYWGATALEVHKDRWTPDNPNARFPRLTFNEPNNEQNSSFWVADASYLRLKNLTVGYTLPQQLLNRINISRLRFYVSGQNLLTFDKFWEGYDPEAPVGAGSYYPQVKVFTFGIDTTF